MPHTQLLMKFLTGICLAGMLASCTPTKNMIYLQESEGAPSPPEAALPDYRLKSGDMMYIDVESAGLAEQKGLFQQQQQQSTRSTGGNTIGSASVYLSSYRISASGHVKLPMIGKLKLNGMTIEEADSMIQQEVDQYLKDAVVRVRLVNFKVTIFGEVNRPGSYEVYQPDINILELISHAGDVTPYANRQKVMLIRQQEGIQDTTVYLDLTSRNVLHSRYFYLKPGDQVYVRPHLLSKTTGFASIPWSTIFSAISSTILIINFISN